MTAVCCSVLFLFGILYTYNRGSLLAGTVALVTFAWFAAQKWRVAIVAALAGAAALVVVPWQGKDAIIGLLGLQQAKTDMGFFSTTSLAQRMGAQLRGLEVYSAAPIIGVGPGHLGLRMPDPKIPQIFNVQNFDPYTQEMYANTNNPESRTNSHRERNKTQSHPIQSFTHFHNAISRLSTLCDIPISQHFSNI